MNRLIKLILIAVLSAAISLPLYSQKLFIGNPESIPPELDSIYLKGLGYLQKSQNSTGQFQGQYGNAPGVIGLCVIATKRVSVFLRISSRRSQKRSTL